MADVKTKAGSKTDDGIYQVIDKLDNGVSSVAQGQMNYLLNALTIAGHTADLDSEYDTAIKALKEKITAAETAVSSFYSEYGDMPVALYTFDWSSSNTSDKITMAQDIVETGSQISYPHSSLLL